MGSLRSSKKEIPSTQHYRSLMKGILLIVVVVPIVPVILVSIVMLYQFQGSYKGKVYAHLRDVSRTGKKNIDDFLNDRLADIRFVAEKFNPAHLDHESFLRDRLKILQQKHGPVFVDLSIVDDDGIEIAHVGPGERAEKKFSDAAWYKEAVESGSVITDASSGSGGHSTITLAVSMEWKGKRWVFRSGLGHEILQQRIGDIRIGKTGVAFVLNRHGEVQVEPPAGVRPPQGGFASLSALYGPEGGTPSVMTRKDSAGNKNIYTAAFLNNGRWLLVFQQRTSEAFAGLRKVQLTALAVVLIIGFLIAAWAIRLSRNMVRRIALADKKKEKMNEQMYQTSKLASIGELASGIAHEINNPVAIMVEEAGWIDDLLREEEFKESKNLEEFKRALKQIQTQGKRCREITHKLLSFARKTGSKAQEVQVNGLIEDIVAISEKSAKSNRIVFKKDFQQDLPAIRVSQTELQQVILNLINNALDAMEKGGEITISTRSGRENIVIEVSDTGPGIPEEDLKRIFDPFFTTKPVGKGTGLGLSICYGIIKELGGDINVHSEAGAGTTFRITIPLSEKKQEGPEPAGEGKPAIHGGDE